MEKRDDVPEGKGKINIESKGVKKRADKGQRREREGKREGAHTWWSPAELKC